MSRLPLLPAAQPSCAVLVLAARMASRSEQSPLLSSSSAVESTVIVAARRGRRDQQSQGDGAPAVARERKERMRA